MSRKPKAEPCVTYKVPLAMVDKVSTMSTAQLQPYKYRECRELSINLLLDKAVEMGAKYVYPAWFGLNAEVFQIVDLRTGDVVEKKYITWADIHEDGNIGYDLTHDVIRLFVF